MNSKSKFAFTFFAVTTLFYVPAAAHLARNLAAVESSEISEPPNISPAPSDGFVYKGKCLGRCQDSRNLTGCLQFSPTTAKEGYLYMKNDGQSPLKVNVTISHPKITFSDIEIPKQGTKKINFSASIGESRTIVLNAGYGECIVQMGSISYSSMFKKFSFHGYPIYGACLLFLTVLSAGVTWACCKSRKSEQEVDGVSYQDLEMAKPESLAVGSMETMEGWDQDWGDKWDEIEAEKPSGEHQMVNGSADDLPSRSSDKDGWENNWND